MRHLDDTQPSRSLDPRVRAPAQGPPRLLFCGVILIFLLFVLGVIGAVAGFRLILQPAQQQRVIDQLPFMRMLLQPTPAGGVFPTLASQSGARNALDLLDMPLPAASPTSLPDAQLIEMPPATPASADPPTAFPQPSATMAATDSAGSSAATPTPSHSAEAISQLPPSARIYGLLHHRQTWNNCGPATITMALSYYGWQRDQSAAGNALKPNREDKNVSPDELVDFVNEASSVKAMARMGGDLDLLKALVANGFPVVIETGAMFEAYDWIGHYRALVAYDDAYQLFYFFDSFLGVGDGAQGVTESYARVDSDWQAFNRTFIVIYEPGREGLLRSVMDRHWHAQDAATIALETAKAEARLQPNNAFAWFNMGTSLVALDRFQEAAVAYDQAQRLKQLPWRMMWYQFGAFEAFYEVGRYDDVLSLARININSAEEIEETYYWQGRALAAQGQPQQAASSFRRALSYNPNYDEAREALAGLN